MGYRRGIYVVLLCVLAASWCAAALARSEGSSDDLDRRIASLIEQLGDKQYAVRQRAQDALVNIGFDAFDALREAESNDDPEIAMQAGYLVRRIRANWTDEDDPPEIQAILANYETQSRERRLVRIKQLAELPGNLGLEWLCRLVRFEESPVLSRQAALAIMERDPPVEDAVWDKRAEVIARHMQRSRRRAAKWLLVYLKAHDDPAGALPAWSDLTDAERRTLDAHPQETDSRIVIDLLLRKVDLLDRLGRSEDVDDVMHQMVLCERGDSASLIELVDWLARRKAWNLIDEVAARFAATFELDATLLYALCEARRAQGNDELANATAQRALKLGGDNPVEHLDVVERLMERGLTEWSDRELRYVIGLGTVASPAGIQARVILSDSLHDRQRDAEAAAVLKELMDGIDRDAEMMKQVKLLLQQSRTSVDLLRARMYFYFACDAKRQGNVDQQRNHLDKALDEAPSDLDVLIALYKTQDDDPARRARLSELIDNVVETCRGAIEDNPDEPVNYNELAWLVANTEGDIDEAIRLSQKSVEMVRAEATSQEDFRRLGQYLDTLAHCYFAKRDFEAAVKYQTEAVKLDPYTGAISRQLEVFRKALAASEADAPADKR